MVLKSTLLSESLNKVRYVILGVQCCADGRWLHIYTGVVLIVHCQRSSHWWWLSVYALRVKRSSAGKVKSINAIMPSDPDLDFWNIENLQRVWGGRQCGIWTMLWKRACKQTLKRSLRSHLDGHLKEPLSIPHHQYHKKISEGIVTRFHTWKEYALQVNHMQIRIKVSLRETKRYFCTWNVSRTEDKSKFKQAMQSHGWK